MNSVNLADIFAGLANRWPERKALISSHLDLTHAQLIARAARSARELRRYDIAPGAKVGLCLRDGAETVVSMLAVWMLGATVVPIDFRKNAAERMALVKEFGLTAIIEDRQGPASEYGSILADATWTDRIAQHDPNLISAADAEPAPAVISLTSGTTAQPIGIVLDHERMLLRSICDVPLLYGESLLNPLPLSFSGSRSHTFSALLHGSAVYFHPVLFTAESFAEAIQSWGVTSVCAVPTIIRNLINLFRERSAPVFDPVKRDTKTGLIEAVRGGLAPIGGNWIWSVHGAFGHRLFKLRLPPFPAGHSQAAARGPGDRAMFDLAIDSKLKGPSKKPDPASLLTEQTRGGGLAGSLTVPLGKNIPSIGRFSYGMRLAIREWNSTDVGGKPMLKAALIVAFIAGAALSPSSAGSQDLCNDAHMKQMDEMIAKMTDEAKKKEATMHLDMSKAEMKKGNTAECMKHMNEAHKAMGM